ncbi:MAG: hypothetical protein M3305_16675 [Actinomycetota bacterium]|nr:hypothetical protein [Actinomycetota bacterium]
MARLLDVTGGDLLMLSTPYGERDVFHKAFSNAIDWSVYPAQGQGVYPNEPVLPRGAAPHPDGAPVL